MSLTSTAITALSFRLAAEQIVQREGSRLVVLSPAHSNDPNDPNHSYSKYTPTAKFEFNVTNEAVFDALEAGVVYKLLMVREDSGALLTFIPPPPAPDAAVEGSTNQTDGALSDTASSGTGATGGETSAPAPADPPIDAPAAPAVSDTPVIDAAAAAVVAASTTTSAEDAPAAPPTTSSTPTA